MSAKCKKIEKKKLMLVCIPLKKEAVTAIPIFYQKMAQPTEPGMIFSGMTLSND